MRSYLLDLLTLIRSKWRQISQMFLKWKTSIKVNLKEWERRKKTRFQTTKVSDVSHFVIRHFICNRQCECAYSVIFIQKMLFDIQLFILVHLVGTFYCACLYTLYCDKTTSVDKTHTKQFKMSNLSNYINAID